MKKVFLSAVALFAFSVASAQMKFGVKAGFTAQSVSVPTATGYGYSIYGGSANVTNSGFFAGAFLDIPLAEKWQFHPEVEFAAVTDNNMIVAPMLVKYEIIEGLNAFAGPGLNYSLDLPKDEFQVSADFGASYDFTEHFGADLRYDVGLMGDYKVSGLFVGAYYKF